MAGRYCGLSGTVCEDACWEKEGFDPCWGTKVEGFGWEGLFVCMCVCRVMMERRGIGDDISQSDGTHDSIALINSFDIKYANHDWNSRNPDPFPLSLSIPSLVRP
jgi:hypothetical protein